MANLTEQPAKGTQEVAASAAPNTSGMSRRTLLRGAAPAIVTLYSGAALAQSSNLISAKSNATAENYKYRCLDTASVSTTTKSGVYDLGSPAMGHVTQVSSDKQYYGINSYGNINFAAGPVAPSQMCSTGGYYARKDWGGFTRVRVSRGVLVSATAISSFADKITYTNI